MTAWLVTWLVQGLVLSGVVAAGAHGPRKLNASTRYAAWIIAFLSLAVLGLITSPHAGNAATLGSAAGNEPLVYIDALSSAALSAFLGVWAAGALMNLVRIVPAIHAVYALRDRCRPFPAEVESRLPLWLEVKGGRRRPQLMVCHEVKAATVLGFSRPYIAIPDAFLTSLTTAELDEVVLHENAHVRRADDWARLLQSMLQSVLWIHPAAAIVDRALDRERELACDEWVVARTGLPKAYARTLARAAEVMLQSRCGQPRLTPALFAPRHDLVRRIDCLLATRGKTRRRVSLLPVAGVLTLTIFTASQLTSITLIAEIGDLMTPLEPVGPVRTAAIPQYAHDAATVWGDALRPGVERESDANTVTDTDMRAAQPVVVQAARESAAEPSPLAARAFEGRYSTPASVSVSRQPGPWRRVGDTAAQIGIGAGKTGSDLASRVSRVGISLARQF